MKRWLSLAISILALAVAPATVLAGEDSAHFGPINSGSSDSGTCGPNWANDTYKQVFDAATMPNSDGTYNVTSFGFTYHAHGHDLLQREWHNASADQGGNSGDIRSS